MEQLTTPAHASATTTAAWTNNQRILFRFAVAWFLLYIFFNPNGVLPGLDEAFNFYITPFHRLIPWIAKHILHLARPVPIIIDNGSGDSTYDYLTLLFISVISILTSAIWTLLDRKRTSYSVLYYWLTTILRYYL